MSNSQLQIVANSETDFNPVHFISAEKYGLVKTASSNVKPPFTVEEYRIAYENGKRIAKGLQDAIDLNKSEAVLEYGNYPILYPNEEGHTAYGSMVRRGSIEIDAKSRNLNFNLNNSVIYVLYDSDNKHQYDKSPETHLPFELVGSVITYENGRGFTYSNGTIKGEQYCRAFTNPKEYKIEQTYGIKAKFNNRNTYFKNMKFTGFRGDGLSGFGRGRVIANFGLTTWYKGTIDADGNDTELVGAYRTLPVSIEGVELIDGKLQIQALAVHKIRFREDNLQVCFYDKNDVLLGKSWTTQNADFMPYKNTSYLRFVAFGDERTTDTVRYARYTWAIELATGMSSGFFVDGACEFWENMRGGISNLGNNVAVEPMCSFHDQGMLTKQGFTPYGHTTQYAINLEDTHYSNLHVDGIQVTDVPQGVLSNTRIFKVINSSFSGLVFGAVGNYGCTYTHTANNTVESTRRRGGELGTTSSAFFLKEHTSSPMHWNITGNNLSDSDLTVGSKRQNTFVSITDNHINRGRFVAKGYKRNFKILNNTLNDMGGGGDFLIGLELSGFADNNQVTGENINSRVTISVDSEGDTLNMVNIKGADRKPMAVAIMPNKEGGLTKFNNTHLVTDSAVANMALNISNRKEDDDTSIDYSEIRNVIFDGVGLETRGISWKSWKPADISIIDSKFLKGATLGFNYKYDRAVDNVIRYIDTSFDMDDIPYLFKNNADIVGSLTIIFERCRFFAKSHKEVKFIVGKTDGIIATAIDCELDNVVNTDDILKFN